MVTSINDKVRKKIINIDSKELTILNLENLDTETYNQVITLLLLDYYKINFFMEDTKFYNDFNDEIENIVERTYTDSDFLTLILTCSIIFQELCTLSKITLLESLETKGQDENLMKISKLHLFDKISYKFDYSLDSFKEYYLDFKNKNKRTPGKMEVSFFIANKLIEYKDIRYNEFQKMVLEFIKVYYKWNVFIRDNCPPKSLENIDHSYLNLIKNNKIGPLIEHIGKNVDFLTALIDGYLFYSVGEKKISEKVVDEYFYKTVDEDTQKKLKLKRD